MLRSQILREMASLASLLKKEAPANLPLETLDAWIDELEPVAKYYEDLCELRS
ncbi:MAG: hypothetical protein ACAI35_03030 [Candidatus Methylacidiphilales bacterium]